MYEEYPSLLTDILGVLATHGWERSEGTDFVNKALENLCTQFAIPLQKAGIEASSNQG